MKTYIEKAFILQKQAKDFLIKRGIHELFAKYGEVLYAGSYALDLMIWKDIDLNIIVKKRDMKICVKNLVQDLLDRDDILRVKVFRDLRKKYGQSMPRGDYVGILLEGWKLDVFVVNEIEGIETKKKTELTKSLLTKETKEIILYWKEKLLTSSGRSPKFSSFHLYNAILQEKLTKEEDIYSYLRINGIKV